MRSGLSGSGRLATLAPQHPTRIVEAAEKLTDRLTLVNLSPQV